MSSSHNKRVSAARQDVIAALILLLMTLAATGRALFVPGQMVLWDEIMTFAIRENFVREMLSQGSLPLWTPYQAYGYPAYAWPMPFVFYPPEALLRWLPLHTFFNVSAVLHVWLIGVGTYALCRDLKMERLPSLLSGGSFMLSGVVVGRLVWGHPSIVYALAWLPWVSLVYRRALLTGRWRYTWISTLLAAGALFTGHLEYVMITLLIPVMGCAAWGGTRAWEGDWRALARGLLQSAVVGAAGLSISAVFWTPVVQFMSQTLHGVDHPLSVIAQFQALPQDALTLILPHVFFNPEIRMLIGGRFFAEMGYYTGAVGLALALISLTHAERSRRGAIWFLVGIGALGVTLALGSRSLVYHLAYDLVPVLHVMRAPARFGLWGVFSLCLLSGFGLEGLLNHSLRDNNHPGAAQILTLAGAVLAWTAWIVWGRIGTGVIEKLKASTAQWRGDPITIARFEAANLLILAIVLSASALIAWLRVHPRFPRQIWAGLLVAVALLDMTAFGARSLNPRAALSLTKPTPESLPPALAVDPGEARVAVEIYEGASLAHLAKTSVIGGTFVLLRVEEIARLGKYDGRGSQLLNVRYVLTDRPDLPGSPRVVWESRDVRLFEYPQVLPRVYAAPGVQLVSDRDAGVAALTADDFDPRQAVVVEESEGHPDLPEGPSGETDFWYTMVDYAPNALTARVRSDRAVMVVFSEAYYPGWQAWVDGEEVRIWQVNHAFRGVIVGAGEHTITMRFTWLLLRALAVLSAGALGVVAGGLIVAVARERRSSQRTLPAQ